MPLLETKGAGSAQGFGLSLGGEEAVYIEDVFSTYLYTGNGSTQTITNGIDLAGEGGLVWTKPRTTTTFNDHILVDNARGDFQIQSNTTAANNAIASFNFASTGYTAPSNTRVNASSVDYASWTFRKAPKFFDVVTYTGNGVAGRAVPHNLNAEVGFAVVKRTNGVTNWEAQHRSLDLSGNKGIYLNTTNALATHNNVWNSTHATSTDLILGPHEDVNGVGGTYVAYLFAHNAGGFGLTGLDNVISCGTFTTDGAGAATVTLGYEPQWAMVKSSSASGNWLLKDNMRGTPVGTAGPVLYPNLSDAEANFQTLSPTATGFSISGLGGSTTYIYIAIRRGPMKVPTSGTQIYNAIARTGTGAVANVTGLGFTPDMLIGTPRSVTSGDRLVMDRLRGRGNLLANLTNQEANSLGNYDYTSINMDGFSVYLDQYGNVNYPGAPIINWAFKRAPGFFDEVCYTGNDTARTLAHNLAAVPELMIVKSRSGTGNWSVYVAATTGTNVMYLNTTNASFGASGYWNNTAPTASVFTIGNTGDVNNSGTTFVAYLFATLAGVSKVGSYTGTGTTQTINCGFTAGARFVLIKKTSGTGSWYVWDSARGIVAGNDPYLLLNSTAAEVTSTDYVDTASVGFEISSTAPSEINENGGSFIFFAVA